MRRLGCRILAPRAGGVPVHAALRTLGRDGIAALLDRCCARARQFAALLASDQGVRVLDDGVLNQVLVRFEDDQILTCAVIEGVQREGTCWLSGASRHGVAAMRASVSNQCTREDDVDASAQAVLRVLRAESGVS